MKKTLTSLIAIVILVILLVVITKATDRKIVDNSTIKIGAILSETGVAAAFGEMSHKGIDIAVEEINKNGGINKRQVSVIFEDDQTDPKAAVGSFQKLSSIDGVNAIIGSNFDFVTQPLFSLVKENKKQVVVSPSNPRIAGSFDTNSHSFVMMTEFDEIIRVFKDYLQGVTYKQMGILRFESTFAEQIQKTLNDIQVELGKKPIVVETYKQIGNNDFRTQILKLKQAGVDLVFLDMIAIDPVTFVNQAKQLGYTPKLLSHVGLQDALSIKDVDPKIFDGTVAVNWNVSTTDFTEKFKAKYGTNPDKSANRAYDAVYVLANAIDKSGGDASMLPQILETESFITPNGTIKFNQNHAATSTDVRLEVVKEGKFIPYVK